MPNKTNTAIVGGNVTGNIGSCKVEETYIHLDSWYKQTVYVNSCSGEVIQKSDVFFDYGVIYFPLIFVLVIVMIGAIFRFLFD